MSVTLDDPVVAIASGRVRGRRGEGVARFLGIPFAAPPVGGLRFQAPAPVPRWDGVRDAGAYGPTAPQPYRAHTLIPEPTSDGADYLNLNIFTPGGKGDGLPVFFWIHGGGFFAGCNRSPWWSGHRFARDGIVFVSVGYRLGAEGFMPMRGAPANRGVLDWLAALHWVHENIAAFGGDPGQITIGGQSAGAIACATLMATPRAKGLFNRVVGMSGSIGFGLSQEKAEAIGREFCAALGTSSAAEAIAGKSVEDFIAAQVVASGREGGATAMETAIGFGRGLAFQPVVDGDLLPQSTNQAVRAGIGADIPIFLSVTAEEFDFTARAGGAGLAEGDLPTALGHLHLDPQDVEPYRRLHGDLSPAGLVGRAISDRLFRARMTFMGEARLDAPAPTYLAEFRWKPHPPVAGNYGASHCLDVPFAFDVLDAPGVAALAGPRPPQSIATGLHRAWADFIKAGDPGIPAYRADQRRATVLDAAMRTEADPFRGERAFWNASAWSRE